MQRPDGSCYTLLQPHLFNIFCGFVLGCLPGKGYSLGLLGRGIIHGSTYLAYGLLNLPFMESF